ncbi:hypothetical protein [Aestuariispira insulae]|uniref:Lipoprotein n=1 Tax=Aestuariispira insulae TaxID=1461337 RepID=A0A3D9HPY4_9PROT|nr:hypothetical protein [Aestuariispira insulae]RED51573.1 hypothetical protein DFP90_103376 [Aestuariispira insulae]
MIRILMMLTLAAFTAGSLSACQVSAKGKEGAVTVETGDVDDDGAKKDGKFCPPGQAKKGTC